MKKLIIVFFLFIMVGCSPSPEVVQKALSETMAAIAAETASAMPTETPLPTITPTKTATPIPTITLTPTITPTSQIGDWIVTSDTSAFDDSKTVTLSLIAENPVNGWLETSFPILAIRCKEKELEVFVATGQQFDVEYGLYNKSHVRLRFDENEATTVIAGHSTDGKALFFKSADYLVNTMLKSKKLILGFTPFNASPVDTSFDLTGLSVAIAPLISACPNSSIYVP